MPVRGAGLKHLSELPEHSGALKHAAGEPHVVVLLANSATHAPLLHCLPLTHGPDSGAELHGLPSVGAPRVAQSPVAPEQTGASRHSLWLPHRVPAARKVGSHAPESVLHVYDATQGGIDDGLQSDAFSTHSCACTLFHSIVIAIIIVTTCINVMCSLVIFCFFSVFGCHPEAS